MNRIRLMKPYVSFDEVEQEFRDIFTSGMFTQGKHAECFRREIEAYTGARHAFLTTSATTALWTCLKLLEIGPGDEVIVSDFSFPASANVIEDLGARPVFADVSLETFNMMPQELEQKINNKTKAVMFVDAFGNPTGLHDIKAVCDAHDLPLIEDAACAMGSVEQGRRCGAIADLTCFSFHPRKLICAGEGGAITTNRDDWAEWLAVKLAHGASGMKGAGLNFVDYGYNFRMSELQAVMGRKQLARIDEIVDARLEELARYRAGLESLGFLAQVAGEEVRHNAQSLVFRVPEGVARDALIVALREAGVESTIGTYALSATSYYRQCYADIQPNARLLENNTITLPCYDGVDVDYVEAMIRRGLRR